MLIDYDGGNLKMDTGYVAYLLRNYYKASTALINIGTCENIPEELRRLCIEASSATSKIIDYINAHKEE